MKPCFALAAGTRRLGTGSVASGSDTDEASGGALVSMAGRGVSCARKANGSPSTLSVGPHRGATLGRGRHSIMVALGGPRRKARPERASEVVCARRPLARCEVDGDRPLRTCTLERRPPRFHRGHGLLGNRRWDDAVQSTAEASAEEPWQDVAQDRAALGGRAWWARSSVVFSEARWSTPCHTHTPHARREPPGVALFCDNSGIEAAHTCEQRLVVVCPQGDMEVCAESVGLNNQVGYGRDGERVVLEKM